MSTSLKITPDDIDALARIVEAEAGDQPIHGRVAVVDTIVNRASAGRRWPSSIQGVISQPKQFEPVTSAGGWKNLPPATDTTRALVLDALKTRATGARPDASLGAVYFYDPTLTAKRGTDFASSVAPTTVIGGHAFFNATNSDKPIDLKPQPIVFDDGLSQVERASAALSQGTSAPTFAPYQEASARAAASGNALHPSFGADAPQQGYDAAALSSRARSGVDVTRFSQPLGSGLAQLIADAPGRITITSGYRSPERQSEILEETLTKRAGPEAAARWRAEVSAHNGDVVAAGAAARPWLRDLGITQWVAPPGASHHQKGTASDLDFQDDATRSWAHANAAKYGLAFPLGNEPWHVQPLAGSGSLPASPSLQASGLQRGLDATPAPVTAFTAPSGGARDATPLAQPDAAQRPSQPQQTGQSEDALLARLASELGVPLAALKSAAPSLRDPRIAELQTSPYGAFAAAYLAGKS